MSHTLLHEGRGVRQRLALAALMVFASGLSESSLAQTCPFDDGNSSLTVEGVILTRYALGITGAPLVASTGINAADAPTVEAAITCPSCGLNITGNPTMTVADATIISRKLAGFSGAALTNDLALGSGTRNTSAAVQSFLLAGCGATGGTVTSITAGSGLTGGTITASGTIAVNTAVIQSRVSGSCTVGSSIRAIAADGTVTCQTDAVGGSGTVTGLLTGIGINGGPITTVGTINIEPTFRLPQACINNQYARYNAGTSTWDCVTPVAVVNVATGAGLTGGPITTTGTITADTAYLQRRVVNTCVVGSAIRSVAADGSVTCETVPGVGNVWLQGGNAVAATGVLGTTTAQSLSLISGANASIDIGSGNGLHLNRMSNFAYPEVIAVTNGSTANSAGFYGATVSGGGSTSGTSCAPNVTCGNLATGPFATVAGGRANVAGAGVSSVGTASTVSGGEINTASGTASTVVGGSRNQATASYSTAIGRNAIARNWGQVAHAGGGFGTAPDFTPGTSQYSRMVLSRVTTAAIDNELTANGGTGTSDETIRLRFLPGQTALMEASVLGKEVGTTNVAAYSFRCIVIVDAAAVMTLQPPDCGKSVVFESVAGWDANAVAVPLPLPEGGVVRLNVKGTSGPFTRWVATVHISELME